MLCQKPHIWTPRKGQTMLHLMGCLMVAHILAHQHRHSLRNRASSHQRQPPTHTHDPKGHSVIQQCGTLSLPRNSNK
jgi:hypothetical protein